MAAYTIKVRPNDPVNFTAKAPVQMNLGHQPSIGEKIKLTAAQMPSLAGKDIAALFGSATDELGEPWLWGIVTMICLDTTQGGTGTPTVILAWPVNIAELT